MTKSGNGLFKCKFGYPWGSYSQGGDFVIIGLFYSVTVGVNIDD